MGAYDDGGMTKAKSAAGLSTSQSTLATKVTVQRGDTLSKIAKEAGTTVKEIIAANPKFVNDPKYKGGNLIFAGTKVNLPTKKDILTPSSTSQTTTTTTTTTDTTTTVDSEPMTPATTPTFVAPVVAQPPPPPVKTAPIDTVLFDDEGTPIEVMTDLIFENIGGHELINIARNDIVNGQQVSYQPIKNLSSIQQQYNPNNIVSLQSTSDKYFANFSIKLENKVPQPGTGPNGAHVYLDDNTGNMIIEAINLEIDEQIEVEITTSGTIYEAEFGEITS